MKYDKILVAYYSRDGHTKQVAEEIAKALQADVEEIVDSKNRKGIFGWIMAGRDGMTKKEADIGPLKYDPADYDLVILGTPMWAGKMTPALRTYLNQHKGKFKATACIVTTGNTSPERVVEGINELADTHAISSVGVITKDFKSPEAYQEKVQSFLKAIQA